MFQNLNKPKCKTFLPLSISGERCNPVVNPEEKGRQEPEFLSRSTQLFQHIFDFLIKEGNMKTNEAILDRIITNL